MGCGVANRINENISENVKKAQKVSLLGNQEEYEKALFDRDVEKEGLLQSNRKGKPIDLPKESVKNHWIFQVEQNFVNEAFIVKPWSGVLKVPDDYSSEMRQGVCSSLECEYVYGYQCLESRNNLFYTSEPFTVVFPAGIFGVVYNYSKNSQLLYKNHKDEIVSLCIHKETHTVATGDKRHMICIWDLRKLTTFKEHKTQVKGTLSLAFCSNSDFLAVLSGDFRLTLFKWHDFSSIFTTSFDSIVFFVAVHSKDLQFSVVGQKFVSFVQSSGKAENGVFGNKGKICTMTSAVWWKDFCLTAASNGQVYRWTPPVLDSAFQVFELGVTVHALKVFNDQVFCAGADRTLVILGSEMEILNKINLESFARSIDWDQDLILLGLANGSVVFVRDGEVNEVFFGFCQEIVEISRVSESLVIVATESEVRVIDYLQRKEVNKISKKNLFDAAYSIQDAAQVKIKALDYSQALSHIAISIGTGFLSIYSFTNSIRNLTFLKVSEYEVVTLKYSPNGSYLVCYSKDSVLIIDIPSYSIKTSCFYSNRVKTIDWSKKSRHFQTNGENYDLKFWSVDGSELEELNETLSSWTSRVGWPLKNLKESFIDLSHITSIKSDSGLALIAAGDDWGCLKVFQVLGETGVKIKCHASHVRALAWSSRNDLIFSGGNLCVAETRVTLKSNI
jgi:WD40 repeat protein